MLKIRAKQIGLAIVAVGTAVGALVAACKATVEAKEIIADESLTKPQKAVKIAGAYAIAVGSAVASGLAARECFNIEKQDREANEMLLSERTEAIEAYRKDISKDVKQENLVWMKSNEQRLTSGCCPYKENEVDYAAGQVPVYDQLHKSWKIMSRDDLLNAEKTIIARVNNGKTCTINDYFKLVGRSKKEFGDFLAWKKTPSDTIDGLFDYVVEKDANTDMIYTIVLYKYIPSSVKKEGDAK